MSELDDIWTKKCGIKDEIAKLLYQVLVLRNKYIVHLEKEKTMKLQIGELIEKMKLLNKEIDELDKQLEIEKVL